jgi:putative membrane protein
MVRFLLHALVAAIGFWVAAHIVPGVHIADLKALLIAGLLLGVVNALVRPIVTILTFPITVLTLGLFLLVVNALMILLVGWLMQKFGVAGFEIRGIVPAVLTTIVVWFVSWVAGLFIGPARR